MSNDIKTLADAQPGGRVRLGDQLPPLPYPNYPVSKTGLQNNAYTASQMWDYARGALSAQPSPGGQGEARAESLLAALVKIRDSTFRDAAALRGIADMAINSDRARDFKLAARQPSKQPDSVALGEATEFCIEKGDRQPVGEQRAALWIQFAENGNIRFWTKDQDRALAESFLHARPLTAFYASPQQPAQAVDLGQSIPSELQPVAAALKRFEECAEDCGSEGCDIGRAWFDALTTMGLLRRTQRSPAVWTMTAEGERLLALLDSKAVGNG
ncbi:MAG TPA: hypothetical protein DD677_04470 [Stenotrophomonas sp.]|nr:hypothetical protein [Stenotrophomonas sp.]